MDCIVLGGEPQDINCHGCACDECTVKSKIRGLEAARDQWKELAQARYKKMCDARLEVKELNSKYLQAVQDAENLKNEVDWLRGNQQRNAKQHNGKVSELATKCLDLEAEVRDLKKTNNMLKRTLQHKDELLEFLK